MIDRLSSIAPAFSIRKLLIFSGALLRAAVRSDRPAGPLLAAIASVRSLSFAGAELRRLIPAASAARLFPAAPVARFFRAAAAVRFSPAAVRFSPAAVRHLSATIMAASLLLTFSAISDSYGIERAVVTVVHTNDIHSQLSADMDGVDPVGGMARIATLINRIRASEPYVIVLDAGDFLLGTPFFTFYGGRAEVECMNAIGYDAVAVGNHELDSGPRAILKLEDTAEFPFLSANLAWRQSGKPLFERYILFETEENISIAVLGLTTAGIPGLVRPSAISSLSSNSPTRAASELVPILRESADAVIVLSHLGLDDDKKLARQVPGIDLIVGGHSHDVLEKPLRIANKDAEGRPTYTYIVQAGKQGTHLGRVDLFFEDGDLALIEAELIPVTSVVAEDPKVGRIVAKYWESMEGAVTSVVAYASGEFPCDGSLRAGESPLGNLVADAVRAATGADFAVQNSGGIRSGFRQGPVKVWDVYAALPFDNRLELIELNGEQVNKLVADMARRLGRGSFCQVSGISFEIADKKPSEIRVGGAPVVEDKTYTVGVVDYLTDGGCQYETLMNAKVLSRSSEFQRDLAVKYLKQLKVLRPTNEGRIRVQR